VRGEWLTANVVVHTPGTDLEGRKGWKQYATMFLTTFPDLHIAVEDIIAEGDKVVACWTASGTHKGLLRRIGPTGKQVTFTGVTIYRFAGGKIEEGWALNDTLGLMQQLGVVQPIGQ